MKTKLSIAVVAISLAGALAAPTYVSADDHKQNQTDAERYGDSSGHLDKGARINEHIDNKGERINDQYERAADQAAVNGDKKKARQLEKQGDAIQKEYDKKGDAAQLNYDRNHDSGEYNRERNSDRY